MASSSSGDHLSTLRSGTEEASVSPHIFSPRADDTDGSSAASSPGRQRQRQEQAGPAIPKKRKAGFASRGVANLTPEQLAKKRANDREAQRNIRERNKALVEELRARIASLESQQPYQDLQAALRAKEAVEAENANLKRRVMSVLSMLQPIVSSPDSQSVYPSPGPSLLSTHQHQQPPPPPPPPAPSPFHAVSTPTSSASPASTTVAPSQTQWPVNNVLHHALPHSNSPPPPQARLLDQQRHEYVNGLDMGTGERLGLDFLLGSAQRPNRIQCGPEGAQDTPRSRHVPMKHDWTGVAQGQPQHYHHQDLNNPPLGYTLGMSLGGGLGGVGEASSEDTGGPSPRVEDGSENVYASMPVKNCPPTCPLDGLLLDFLYERRQRAAEGLPAQEIIGPKYPSVSSLLNPANSQFSHPLSKVFTDILQTFPNLSGLPERVAVLYAMFLFMRWQISPTQENYDRLPPWMAPQPTQLDTLHPAWFDHLPFPQMRNRLIHLYTQNHPQYHHHHHQAGLDDDGSSDGGLHFDNFFIPFTTTLSLNWPYEETDALLQSPDSDEVLINPVFERHLRRLENWTLGDAFAHALPALEGTYNLKSESANMAIRLAQ